MINAIKVKVLVLSYYIFQISNSFAHIFIHYILKSYIKKKKKNQQIDEYHKYKEIKI